MDFKCKLSLISLSVIMLAACGGGSNSDSGSTNQPPNIPETPSVPTNQSPIAVAGSPQSVNLGSVVTLNGSQSSDADKDQLTYQWTIKQKPNNSLVKLSNEKAVSPTFKPDQAGQYIVELTVNDGKVNSSASRVKIDVIAVNHVPIAVAGNPQNVTLGELVTLDGAQSTDEDKDQLTYQWKIKLKPASSQVKLSDEKIVNPTFKPDQAGQYVVELVVNDGKVDSALSLVDIHVVKGNSAPVAIISKTAEEFKVGTKVILESSQSSDSDGDKLSYQWAIQEKPSDSKTQLSLSSSATPSVILDKAGKYIFSLVVNDGKVDSKKTTITFNAVKENSIPVANAGTNQTIKIDKSVQLDGTKSSDADNDKLTYSWSLTSKPAKSAAKLSNSNIVKPNFVPDVEGAYVFSLVVSDGQASSKPSNVTINVEKEKPILILTTIIEDVWLGSSEQTLSLPYSTTASMSKNEVCMGNGCSSNVEVGNFNLEAKGDAFTIVSTKLTSSSPTYTGYISGLSENQVIRKGEKVNFKLLSDFTRGNQVKLHYSFKIKETNQTFDYEVSIKTN
jgi:hypothetical protein